jgi:hypothetical protein
MSLSYIRTTYRVPAKRGQRVRYTGDRGPKAKPREGVIVGAEGAHLRIRMDGDSFSNIYHPTWELEYIDNPVLKDIRHD